MKKSVIKTVRKNKDVKDFMLYLIVGGLATIVEWGIFFLLNQLLNINHLLATAIAFIFSTIANWGFGRLLVFKHSHESLSKELTKIYATSIIGLIINECIMYLGVDILGAHAMLIKIIATGVAFIWNFLVRKHLIYNDGSKPKTKTELFFKEHRGIIISAALIPFIFFGFFKFVVPTNINNFGYDHSWLSGSTIKFVNYWLEEGPANLKFTNYERPKSIESSSLDERVAYLSYPTGETMFVYLSAKIAGKSQITISYLHKFQMIMFALTGVLMTLFIYLFAERTLKIKKDYIKIIISTAIATLWMLMPACAYYLNNVYFADQCVILWTTALILVEYAFRTSKAKKKTVLKALRAFLLYGGILIDYYFWILAFVFFAAEMISAIVSLKKPERKREIISILLWFGIPVILALLTYYFQISQTENWLNILQFKYGMRVTGEGMTLGALLEMIKGRFIVSFTNNGSGSYYFLEFTILATLVAGIIGLIKNKSLKKLFSNPGISIIISIVIATAGQILVFKQHSAIHEFSMIKVAYIISLLPIIIFMEARYFFLNGKKKAKKESDKDILAIFATGFLAIVFITGVPFSSADYAGARIRTADFTLEYELKNHTDYNDVVFSFTKEIEINPPESLAVSHKQVYKVKDLSEIKETMSKYSEGKAVFVVEKEQELEDKNQISKQKCLQKNGEVRFENDRFIIFEIKDLEKCK